MTKHPKFEVVRTDAGWHCRFVAANGRNVWTTEVYTRRENAVRAIELIAETFGGRSGMGAIWPDSFRPFAVVEVWDRDERTTP